MPRLYLQLLQESDPDVDDVIGQSATVDFHELTDTPCMAYDFLTHIINNPDGTRSLYQALVTLRLILPKGQNARAKPTPPTVTLSLARGPLSKSH